MQGPSWYERSPRQGAGREGGIWDLKTGGLSRVGPPARSCNLVWIQAAGATPPGDPLE